MSFLRVYIGKASGEVRHVVEERLISENGVRLMDSAEELQVVSVGFVLDHDWRTPIDRDGQGDAPTTPAHHVWLRIGGLPFDQARDAIAFHPEMPKIHQCPCTLEGVRAHVRANGHRSLPAAVRAWLTHTLPPDEIEALGVAKGMPVSVIKAVDSIRCKRDPNGAGSVRAALERISHRRTEARLAAKVAAWRTDQEKAAELQARAAAAAPAEPQVMHEEPKVRLEAAAPLTVVHELAADLEKGE